MTDIELAACAKAINDAKFETADTIKRLIYKYRRHINLNSFKDFIVIREETLNAVFDILAPEIETDDENVQRYEPEDEEDDDIENEKNDT